jgi:hypothetical protein
MTTAKTRIADLIRSKYKAFRKTGDTATWWAFLETLESLGIDRDQVKTATASIYAAERRLEAYKTSPLFLNKIRAYANAVLYSDVEPFEVTRIISKTCVEIRALSYTQTRTPQDFHAGGFSGHYADNREGQAYTYESNPHGQVLRIRLTKRGWRAGGMNGIRFTMSDTPVRFYDYNF